MTASSLVAVFLALALFCNGSWAAPCDSTVNGQSCDVHTDCCCGAGEADFVYLVDVSSSMRDNIETVRSALNTLVAGLQNNNIDAQHAIVLFSMGTELVLDFTEDITLVQDALTETYVDRESGRVWDPSFQNEHRTMEHSLESTRITLDYSVPNTKATFSKLRVENARSLKVSDADCERYPENIYKDDGNFTGQGCYPSECSSTNNRPFDYLNRTDTFACWGALNFRDGARKVVLVITDEESDVPFYAVNKFAGTAYAATLKEVSRTTPLVASAQEDVDVTADAIIDGEAFVYSFVDTGRSPITHQWGDPNLAAEDSDFTNFDAAATLTALQNDGLGNSVQGQVLADAGSALVRLFDITDLENDIIGMFNGIVADVSGNTGEECLCYVKKCLGDVCVPSFDCVDSSCPHCLIAGSSATQGVLNDCVPLRGVDITDPTDCSICCGLPTCGGTVGNKNAWVNDESSAQCRTPTPSPMPASPMPASPMPGTTGAATTGAATTGVLTTGAATGSTPAPGGSTPAPGGATPAPTGSTTTPTGSTPATGGSTPMPGGATGGSGSGSSGSSVPIASTTGATPTSGINESESAPTISDGSIVTGSAILLAIFLFLA